MKFDNFKWPIMYQDARFKNATFIPKGLVQIAKEWVCAENPEPLVFYGNPGSGKTYLSIAAFRVVCECCHWALWINSIDLDNELLAASRSQEDCEDRIIEKYTEVPVLIWDDLGTERPNERTIRQYYAILDSRFSNKQRTLITTNCNRQQLSDKLGERIASRLNYCRWIEFPKKDLRHDTKW